jgi:hypothetical protein
LQLEEKTLRAIEVCHECGHEHAPGSAHVGIVREGNIVRLNFVRREEADVQRRQTEAGEEDVT